MGDGELCFSYILLCTNILQCAELRGEWLRSRARVAQFSEEIILVREEKRRVLVSLEKDALQWDERQERAQELYSNVAIRDRAAAYAAEQALTQRALAAKFSIQWRRSSSKNTAPVETCRSVTTDEGCEANKAADAVTPNIDIDALDDSDSDSDDDNDDNDDDDDNDGEFLNALQAAGSDEDD
jgi:hypothetical protein